MRIDHSQLPNQRILCIDMKSFYASCSAVMLGLDPLECYLAVVADLKRQGSVVLAASPRLKKEYGIQTGSRLFEIPEDERIQLVQASMATYLRVSTEITRLLHRYVPKEAIHVYSVDESFIHLDGTERLWGNVREVAQNIQDELLRKFQLTCSIGIGPNMLLAKLSLDLEAKFTGIAEWSYEDVPKKLWPVSPLSKMWGIGRRTERTLNRMGIFTVGQLAHYNLKQLEKSFGIMGTQLYYHAWGVDLSELGAPIMERQMSFGKSQVLMRDYTEKDDIKVVILEMCEEVSRRAREQKKAGRTVSLGISYSEQECERGFYRSQSVEEPTNVTTDLYEICLSLLNTYYKGKSVRKISITLSNIVADHLIQLSLFEPNKVKERKLGEVVDRIRRRHGKTAILRAVSYTTAGTARTRAHLVGGHQA